MLIPALALLLGPLPVLAEDARQQATDAAVLSQGAAGTGDETTTREAAARPFDGSRAEDNTVVAPGVTRRSVSLAKPAPGSTQAKVEPPLGVEKPSSGSKLTSGIIMGGAAILGGLQGWFAAGLLGAVAGAGLGLAAAWLFHKKDYGAAFGVTAGAIIGTAFGGPIGGLIGAVVGGILGHFLGKLFL
jgi:hypothetical protein